MSDYQESEGSVLEATKIEESVLREVELRPDVMLDPFWFPLTATVDELSCILAKAYMTKTELLNMGADIGIVEDTNASIARRTRWLRNRGEALPSEIPPLDRVRKRYCTAAALLADEEIEDFGDHELDVRVLADLAMGACHMIAREFLGGHEALFHDL
jgi:hypothetical protein